MNANIARAIELVGRPPINPIGQCFESSIRQIIFATDCPPDARLCHGIAIANFPGQEGLTVGHAWIEYDSDDGTRIAMDTTWGLRQRATTSRKGLKVMHVREYSRAEAQMRWKMLGMPGPWDPAIKAITDRRHG